MGRVGNLVALEWRVLGRGRRSHWSIWRGLSLSLALLGFGLARLTGLAMFASQPQELPANRDFTLKMGLLALAGGNAAWFHGRGGLRRLHRLARVQWLYVFLGGKTYGMRSSPA